MKAFVKSSGQRAIEQPNVRWAHAKFELWMMLRWKSIIIIFPQCDTLLCSALSYISRVLVLCEVGSRQNSSLRQTERQSISRDQTLDQIALWCTGVATQKILLFEHLNTSFFKGEINTGSAPNTTSHRQGMCVCTEIYRRFVSNRLIHSREDTWS